MRERHQEQAVSGSGRMKELLCVGKYNEWDDYPPLKIPLQDLFRFWWNRCVVQEYVVDDVLEEIFDYFTEKMRPTQKEEEQMGLALDLDKLPLLVSSGS